MPRRRRAPTPARRQRHRKPTRCSPTRCSARSRSGATSPPSRCMPSFRYHPAIAPKSADVASRSGRRSSPGEPADDRVPTPVSRPALADQTGRRPVADGRLSAQIAARQVAVGWPRGRASEPSKSAPSKRCKSSFERGLNAVRGPFFSTQTGCNRYSRTRRNGLGRSF